MLISKHLDETLVEKAKQSELERWSKNVYHNVPFTGQHCISTRWVLTEKSINGEQEVKAHLVARGYEEQQLTQNDSPTCTKEVFRLVVTILASKGWKIHS